VICFPAIYFPKHVAAQRNRWGTTQILCPQETQRH